MTEPLEDDLEPADAADPAEQARFAEFLERLQPPPGPLAAPWGPSVVDLLETRFGVPGPARKVLGQLEPVRGGPRGDDHPDRIVVTLR